MVDREMLRRYYDIVRIPLQLYDENGLVENFDVHGFQPNPANNIVQELLRYKYPVCYTMTDDLLECGILRVEHADQYLVIGPSTNLELKRSQAINILAEMKQPLTRVNEILRWFGSIPNYDILRFRGNLHFLDHALNGQSREPVQVPYRENDTAIISIEFEMDYEQHTNRLLEDDVMACIEYGRPDELDRAFANLTSVNTVIERKDPAELRKYKNYIIMAIGIASRAALRGGLDYDSMNMITEKYLQKIEACESLAHLSHIFRQGYIEFAQRVAHINALSTESLVVKRIIKEVNLLIYEKATPTIISNRMGMNCSYLCRHFKQETGKTITEYINDVKVRECKRLLDSTDLPIAQISAMLGYSSQSYLHTVFRKVTDKTPNEFRKRKAKI
jgi:AraC-like DNA-binding protein